MRSLINFALLFVATVFTPSISNAEGQLFSCEIDGFKASYHANEVPRMRSLGAYCNPLKADMTIFCSIGSVRSMFSIDEATSVLESNPRASCETHNVLITNRTTYDNEAEDYRAVDDAAQPLNILITSTRKGFELEDMSVVYFNLGKSTLKPSQKNILKTFAHQFDSSEYKITITGHADSTGNRAFNHTLSLRRAATVKKLLVNYGIHNENIISISALGEEDLRYETQDGKPLVVNRAVEVRVYH